jgi:hypothetical protein
MRKFNKLAALLAACCIAALLGGCTYESGPREFAATNFNKTPQAPPEGLDESPREWLETALEKGRTDPEAQKFWYKGHVKNMILSRSVTSKFNGAVINGKGYNVDARIAAQPYQYYRIDDKHFIRANDYWVTARDEPLAFDVLAGFEDWLPFMDQAVQLEDDKVYGTETAVFQLKMTGADWLAQSQSPLFEPLRQLLAERPELTYILDKSTIKTTFWIGREDRLIHQYETWIILPLPKAGTIDQQVLFQLYKYDDPGIEIKDPEEVEKYLLY